MGPGPPALESDGKLLEIQFRDPSLRPMNQNLDEWGQVIVS